MSTSSETTAGLKSPPTILSSGMDALQALLPTDWVVEPLSESVGGSGSVDLVASVRDQLGNYSRVLVYAKTTFTPRDAAALLAGPLPLLRTVDSLASVLVMAPWLSARTRAMLTEAGVNYLDLTANVHLRLQRPAVLVRTQGADQDPAPASRGRVSLKGTAGGRVVRLLVDVAPPYTATAIAAAVGVSLAQVSRLLATLETEALIQRGHRGLVTDVDWPALLRRRAETYQLYATNTATTYLAPAGINQIIPLLETPDLLLPLDVPTRETPYLAVTASVAASRIAPVAAPSQLALYTRDPQATADALGLLPTDRGADVVLLTPYDEVITQRLRMVDGLGVVALSQLVLDCLAGNGRQPAEGEALVTWMQNRQESWRAPSLAALIEPATGEGDR